MQRKSELTPIELILTNDYPNLSYPTPTESTITKQTHAQDIKEKILIFLNEKNYSPSNLSAICEYIKSIEDTYSYFNHLDNFFTSETGRNTKQKAYSYILGYQNPKITSAFHTAPATTQLLPNDYYSLMILLYFLYAPMVFERFICLNPIDHLSFETQDLLDNYRKLPDDLQERARMYMQKLVEFGVSKGLSNLNKSNTVKKR